MTAGASPPPSYLATLDEIYNLEWVVERRKQIHLVERFVDVHWPHGLPMRLIQVAGTSGKGTTCRLLDRGLDKLEGTRGCLTSPHLFDYRERITVDGEPVPPADIVTTWKRMVRPWIDRDADEHGTTAGFQASTICLALAVFERHEVQNAAIEVGCGGRYDPSMGLPVVATAITNVTADHERELGKRPWQRAIEKGGIGRARLPLYTTEPDEQLRAILETCAEEEGAVFHAVDVQPDIDRELPPHIISNATLAAHLLHDLFGQSVDHWLETILDPPPPLLEEREPGLYVDIAHNEAKMGALANTLRTAGTGPLTAICGLSNDRSGRALKPLLEVSAVQTVLLTDGFHHACPVDRLRETLPDDDRIRHAAGPEQALEEARRLRKEHDRAILITGSTYLIDRLLNPSRELSFLNRHYNWRSS